MILELLLNLALSLPGLSKLSFAAATLDNAVNVLGSLNFLGNIVNIGAAVRNGIIVVVAALVCGSIKLLISFIP